MAESTFIIADNFILKWC